MLVTGRLFPIIVLSVVLLSTSTVDSPAVGVSDGFGVRAGMSAGPSQFIIGAQGEIGPVFSTAYFVPSLDLGFDDPTTAVANIDFRWYLIPLPETGIQFYGSAGPTVVFSPGTDLGLSLTAGVHIPMKSQRRYNLEMRFGIGDIPDFKIVGAVMFGI